MKILSLRLEVLGSLAREVAVLEDLKQLGGRCACVLGKRAGHRVLTSRVSLVMEESAPDAWEDADDRR